MEIQIHNNDNIKSFEASIRNNVAETLQKIKRVPIAVLLWGPNPIDGSATGNCRLGLRKKLKKLGHACFFSEELYVSNDPASVLAQQMAHVENVDLVFSIPDSPGSIAEIHNFSMLPEVSGKIITFLNKKWNGGYSNKSLMYRDSIISPNIELYDDNELPDVIINRAISEVQRLQELFYVLGKRRV